MEASKISNRARWFALFVLTGINLLNYIDRYIFSALLPAIKSDLKFTDTELGLLGSGFLFAYMFASPLFGMLGDRGGRNHLMATGIGIWSAATAFSGLTTSFLGQMLTRASVGLGESAYSVIAPSTIADYFSKKSRGKVFAIYSGAIPIGSALGYVIGGWLEPRVGWQKAFFVVGIPGLFLASLLFFIPDPKRGISEMDENAEPTAPDSQALKTIYHSLFTNGGFLFTVLGYAAYTFVVGGMAFWMPSYLVRYFDVSLEAANVQFGALTVAGGFVGTMIGGYWSDWEERRAGNGFLKVSFLSMLITAPLFWQVLGLHDYKSFMAVLFLLEVALFICISPLDAAVLNYVRPAWRSTAMALNVLLIHLLGDGISRTLMGMVSDAEGLRAAIGILPWALLIAGVLWLIGFVVYWQPVQWPKHAFHIPRWQAHRGLRSSGAAENTIEAFRCARLAGAEMTECDVQLTKDGGAVVFHDDDLRRLGGRIERVADLTLAEMRAMAQAPSLSELLSDPEAPRFINIEIKTKDVLVGQGLEEAVIKAIRDTGSENRVLISSFNPFALRRVAKLARQIPRALIATGEKEPGNSWYLRHLLLGFWASPHVMNLDERMITEKRLERWRDRGIHVFAWTVNERARAKELLRSGTRGIISDILFTEA
jgi:glycerophosphoryl diester phosphodiesterase/MFS family permease